MSVLARDVQAALQTLADAKKRGDSLVRISVAQALAAALAASKGTPDSGAASVTSNRSTSSLSVDSSVAIPLDLARFLLGEAAHRGRWFGEAYAGVPRYWWRTPLRNAIDAAMSADVRSQAKDTQGREPLVRDDQDDTKDAAKRLRRTR